MKRTAILIYALSMLATPLYAAQLYRWIDEKGSVEWRDTPPPATAKKVEQRTISVSAIPANELPYSVQQAMKNFPVTLWANDCGDLCDRARAHLNRRGVPHTDKNPQSEFEAFKKASGGGGEVPLLFVGSSRLKGYLESDWDAALDLAGYPKTVLTPIKPKPKAAVSKPAASEPPAVKLYTSADCGPQCAEAKELLTNRGVRFQEIAADAPATMEELRKISGGTLVPTLAAGRFVVRGLVPADYHSALDQAGFRREQAAAKP
jgi:glutaredoxin